MAKLEEKCPPTQGPAKQASPSRERGWMNRPQPSPVPLSFLSHPEDTLWTDGNPRSKGGPTVLLCHSGLELLKSPAARGDSRGQLSRPEETVMAGMALTSTVISITTCSVTQSWLTLCDPCGLWPARLLCPWDFPGQNTGVGCHFLLQGIFPTKGLNLRLLPWQVGPLPLRQGIVFSWK